MPSIAKLGHIALVTPDLDTSVGFWRDVVGLEEVERHEDVVYLRAWGDWEHHTLSLREGQTAVDHIAYRAGAPEDVDYYAARLAEQEIDVRRVEAGEERGQGESARFALPDAGHPFEIYYDVEKPKLPEGRRSRLKNQTARSWARGVSPRCLDHVNIGCENIESANAWLRSELGFRAREEFVHSQAGLLGSWLSVTTLAHDIALFAWPGGNARFHHVAYYQDNYDDILRASDILREHDIQIDLGPGRHGITQAMFLYCRDPGSGHKLELFSGGYHIYDPDWETITWTEEDLEEGLVWWGERFLPGTGHPMEDTTPCYVETPVSV
jgi:biphenyl-2,3-diol 1,2-dioxygenase